MRVVIQEKISALVEHSIKVADGTGATYIKIQDSIIFSEKVSFSMHHLLNFLFFQDVKNKPNLLKLGTILTLYNVIIDGNL